MSKAVSEKSAKENPAALYCGMVMPISGFGDYSSSHWLDVRDVIERSIAQAGFIARPVWEGTDSDVIHSRMINNIYSDEIMVVDASGLNPNVMFELGMRLAFKKATIIVVDDSTKLPFDTASVEHVVYPTNLYFGKIESFMEKLSERLRLVHASWKEGTYKAFLDSYGAFTVVKPEQRAVEFDQFIMERLEYLSSQINSLRREQINFRTDPKELQDYNRSIQKDTIDAALRHSTRGMDASNISRDRFIKELIASGKSPSDIALILGGSASASSVSDIAKRHGSRPDSGPPS